MSRPVLILLLVLVWVAAERAAAAPLALDEYRVTREGEVLFDPAARRAVLDALSEDDRRAWCGPMVTGWRSHKAVTRLGTPDDDHPVSTDTGSAPFAWTVMNAAASAFGLDHPEARKTVIANLRRWARGAALTKLQDRRDNTYYALERTLLPTIVAYALIRPHPDLTREERRLIERWLNRLVRLRGEKRPDESRGAIAARNNHRYLSASVDMAWGAYRRNDPLFRKGVAAYLAALEDMRPDGSLPLETARGAMALWYQRHAIASLVTIAEMAAVQGYDLYGLEVDGRTLHDAVAFLADAIATPERVWPYAQENLRPGRFANYQVQELGFMRQRGHGRHYMAWLEAYRARFPERTAGQRLWEMLLVQFEEAPRPMIDEYAGGNTTCFFARPE